MIVEERLVTYINSLDTGNTTILDLLNSEVANKSRLHLLKKDIDTSALLFFKYFLIPLKSYQHSKMLFGELACILFNLISHGIS